MTRKYDGGKLRYDLLPPSAIEAIVKVITYGAEKYTVFGDCDCKVLSGTHDSFCGSLVAVSKGDNNWQTVPDMRARYYAAMMRHIAAWRMADKTREPNDPDSGLTHLSHAATCMVFLLSKDVGFDMPIDMVAKEDPK